MSKYHKPNEIIIFKQIAQLITTHDNIFIFHHHYPDGDCLGAQFGLLHLIKTNFANKNVFAVGDHENLYPFLTKTNTNTDLKTIDQQFFNNSLAIVVDSDNISRIKLAEYLFQPNHFTTLLRIDHHKTKANIKYDFEWVDHTYSAVCEQITWMAKQLNWKINLIGAQFLYLGIYTDSGCMSFEKTNGRTFQTVAWLCQQGLQTDKINALLNHQKENLLRFYAFVWSNFKIEAQFAYCYISLATIENYRLNIVESNDANLIGNIEGTKIWAFFIELDQTRVRIRLRSNSISVENALAKFNSYGGHHYSTAGIFDKSLVPKLIEHLKNFSLNEQ
ncbi:Bifunctional oligoribonuclease/PAP phosphatase NrnA, DDH-domain containig protein [[Mycoplasma] cavipharyngis]|uniref:DHH family phosphoesterase n=1 Tax=[Mycoplasma] cavipharyngis TaxID=92757 RepID=UPI00370411DA